MKADTAKRQWKVVIESRLKMLPLWKVNQELRKNRLIWLLGMPSLVHLRKAPERKFLKLLNRQATLLKKLVSSQTVRPSSRNLQLKENTDAVKSGSETEEDISPEKFSDADVDSNKSEWAVFKGEDDFNKVFDIADDANGFAKSLRHEKVTVLSSADASSGSAVDSARAHTASSMSTEVPKPGTENRYARDPRNRNPSMSPGMRNTINRVPQFSNRMREIQFNKNMSPQAQQTLRVETPANKDRSQDSSELGVPKLTAKSYGIFSAQQVDSTCSEQNTPAQVNNYANRNPFKKS